MPRVFIYTEQLTAAVAECVRGAADGYRGVAICRSDTVEVLVAMSPKLARAMAEAMVTLADKIEGDECLDE